MKLISMTDFVLEQDKLLGDYEDFRSVTVSYTQFLKQPLELWMFVPCDEDGNVLEEPKIKNQKVGKHSSVMLWDVEKWKEYQQAKERCLFEGFSVSAISNENTKAIFNNDGCQIRFGLIATISLFKVETIEEMISHTKSNIELTPTAQKQIGCDH